MQKYSQQQLKLNIAQEQLAKCVTYLVYQSLTYCSLDFTKKQLTDPSAFLCAKKQTVMFVTPDSFNIKKKMTKFFASTLTWPGHGWFWQSSSKSVDWISFQKMDISSSSKVLSRTKNLPLASSQLHHSFLFRASK